MTWFTPRRFLMVFTQRGGSTFLSHCLDSRPDIGAERGEPLHERYIWHQTLQDVPPHALLELILNRPGYKATVARVNYRHYHNINTAYLKGLDGIIHLHRENVVRIIISAIINSRGLRTTHTYERLSAQQVYIEPKLLLAECDRYVGNVRAMIANLPKLEVPILWLTYDQIVGGEGQEADGVPWGVDIDICKFLGVGPRPLLCYLKRTNPEHPSALVSNWREVKDALKGTEHERWVK